MLFLFAMCVFLFTYNIKNTSIFLFQLLFVYFLKKRISFNGGRIECLFLKMTTKDKMYINKKQAKINNNYRYSFGSK
jgi:hypothetical protein